MPGFAWRAAAVVPLLLPLAPAQAAGRVAPAAAVKAAFLVKFGAYVDGFPAAPGPLTLCIVGDDTLGDLPAQAAADQRVDGQPIVVRHLTRVTPASGCRIAYLAGSGGQPVEAALAALAASPVLTVTDADAGPARGVIHFEVVDSRVRFRIDQVQAAAARLDISSKLLALALSVRGRGA